MSDGPWDYDGPDPNKPEQWDSSKGTGADVPDTSAFGGTDGTAAPADPAAATN